MGRNRRLLVQIWILTSLLVMAGLLVIYRDLTRVPSLAGRVDPSGIYENPTLLFEDPGLLGSAIEVQVTAEVSACMDVAGLSYRGPAVADPLESLLTPDAGYGIAASPAPPGVELGDGGPQPTSRGAYEQALYGSSLAGAPDGAGCAAVGLQQLDASLAALASMPYSIDQLEADVLSHPASVAALGAWSGCMAMRGYQVESPLDLIREQTRRLATVRGDEARGLAAEERAIAADDRECRRSTLDKALAEVAADLAPVFVDRNRAVLQTLIPPTTGAPAAGDLGTGDVQVTLRWSSSIDLDLQVVDPTGAEIDFSTRTSPSGGELDRDANYPCGTVSEAPVENVFWPTGGAPQGSYRVVVVYRTSCGDLGAQPFDLVVRLQGRVALQEAMEIDPGSSNTFEFEFSL